MTTTSPSGLAIMPDDNLLGVVGRFQKNPPTIFRQMELLNAPLVKFRLAHKKPYYVAQWPALKEITRNWKLYQKGSSEITSTLLGNGLVFSEGETWSTQRRILSPAFHRKAIQSYVSIMRDRTMEVSDRLKSGASVDMNQVFHSIAIQVVRDTLFGTHNNEDELDVVLEGTLHLLNHVVKVRKNPFLPPLWVPTPTNRRSLRYHKKIEQVVLNAIEEKRVSQQQGNTMLELMLWGRDEESESTLTYQEIIDQVKIFFVAGTDTSANTLAWAFYLLSKHPEVLAQVREELDREIGNRPIEMEDIGKLNVLRNVFQETLRLYPATWINSREPVEDVILEGIPVPAGTSLVFSPYMMLRNPALWDAPDEFKPERFAGLDPLPPHYIPFLTGPRKCIGDQFAMTEMIVSMATLLQHFTWEVPQGYQAEPEFSATLGLKGSLPATFKPIQA